MPSRADFSKIMELLELRERFKRRNVDLDETVQKRQQAIQQLEDDLRKVQLQIRKLREYINDGQQKLDGQIFRIGHLGMVTVDDIGKVISALKVALPKAGFGGN